MCAVSSTEACTAVRRPMKARRQRRAAQIAREVACLLEYGTHYLEPKSHLFMGRPFPRMASVTCTRCGRQETHIHWSDNQPYPRQYGRPR